MFRNLEWTKIKSRKKKSIGNRIRQNFLRIIIHQLWFAVSQLRISSTERI